MRKYLASSREAAQYIYEFLGPELRLGTPVAAGKANHLLNHLYDLAKENTQYHLTILTALTLEKPKGKSLLEKRFLEPMVERVFGNYPDLHYELDRTRGGLPKNIDVIEFYFPAGKFIGNKNAQQNYISCNYTHVARDLTARKINLIVSQVACREIDGRKQYSLSCNADVMPDLFQGFKDRQARGEKCLIAVQVNRDLPFMFGDAIREAQDFDLIVDEPSEYYQVFSPPKMSVGDAEYMIGLYGSTLIRDGGELQIGIGTLGDSIAYSLIKRQKKNPEYRKLLSDLKILERFGSEIESMGGLESFEEGLFAATEMFVDGFMFLYQENILKRRVYDDLHIQRLLNERQITEEITPQTLELLMQRGAVIGTLSASEFSYLKKWGIFRDDLSFESGMITHPDGSSCAAHLDHLESRKFIFEKCLGKRLKNAAVMHGGFFLGPTEFYNFLKNMSVDERSLFHMKPVSKINQLFGHEELDKLHRKHARFVNTCLKMTLMGAAASDGLENGQVVSGIGGQYNFVAQAHALPDGRSILNLRSVRGNGSGLASNIVWNYGHISIPRQLRDVVITEYGIADLRSKTDSEVIAALLNISDSRFQDELLREAKRQGKISASHVIPEIHRNNFPETYTRVLGEWKKKGHFPKFPFGTDLTNDEIEIGAALKRLKAKAGGGLGQKLKLFSGLLGPIRESEKTRRLMERMKLQNPRGIGERVMARLLRRELSL